jgi:hypothetical protein
MNTYAHLWYFLVEFFVELEVFQTKFVEQIKTSIMYSIFFFSENLACYEIMCKYNGTARKGTHENVLRRMRIACWIN